MKKLMNSKFAVAACLLSLAGCGTHNDDANTDNLVLEDEALRNAAADFIANAGDRVYFAYDSSALSQEAKTTLARQVEWLQKHPERKVLIEGHCDERGTREYNLGLGERRADAAARSIMSQISGDRIRTISYGKDRPIAAQGSVDEVRRMNRVAIAVIE